MKKNILLALLALVFGQAVAVDPEARRNFPDIEITRNDTYITYLQVFCENSGCAKDARYVVPWDSSGIIAGTIYGRGIGTKVGDDYTVIQLANCKTKTTRIYDGKDGELKKPGKGSVAEAIVKKMCST